MACQQPECEWYVRVTGMSGRALACTKQRSVEGGPEEGASDGGRGHLCTHSAQAALMHPQGIGSNPAPIVHGKHLCTHSAQAALTHSCTHSALAARTQDGACRRLPSSGEQRLRSRRCPCSPRSRVHPTRHLHLLHTHVHTGARTYTRTYTYKCTHTCTHKDMDDQAGAPMRAHLYHVSAA